jgi:hypothetical protein
MGELVQGIRRLINMQIEANRILDRSQPTLDAERQFLRVSRLLSSREYLLEPADRLESMARLTDAWNVVAKATEHFAAEANRVSILFSAHKKGRPDNWRRNPPPDWDALVRTAGSGIPVVWVPRQVVLDEVLASSTYEVKMDVLRRNQEEVLDDCMSAAATVDADPLKDVQCAVIEAVAAARAGFGTAAQALSASAISDLLETALGHRSFGAVRTSFKGVEASETPLMDFRHLLAMQAALPAIENYESVRGVPSRFNRHASAHGVSTLQYSPESMLISMLLAASLLKEASTLLRTDQS